MMDWGMVLTAIASAAGLVASTTVPVWLSNRKTRQQVELAAKAAALTGLAVDEIQGELKTNHGKQAWEYLEMINDVKHGIAEVKNSQDAFLLLFSEHTKADERQFLELGRRIDLALAMGNGASAPSRPAAEPHKEEDQQS